MIKIRSEYLDNHEGLGVCNACGRWAPEADDVICGVCGKTLWELESLDGSDRFAIPSKSDNENNITLKLRNSGVVPVCVRFGKPEGDGRIELQFDHEPLELQPMQEGALHAKGIFSEKKGIFSEKNGKRKSDNVCQVPLICSAKNGMQGPEELMKLIVFEESPPKVKFDFSGKEHEGKTLYPGENLVELYCKNTGGAMQQAKIVPKTPAGVTLSLDEANDKPFEFPPHSEITLHGRCIVTESEISDANKSFAISLDIELIEFLEKKTISITEQFKLAHRGKLELRLEGNKSEVIGLRVRVIRRERRVIDVPIFNAGAEPVRVTEIVPVAVPSDKLVSMGELGWAENSPAIIGQEEQLNFELVVDASKCIAGSNYRSVLIMDGLRVVGRIDLNIDVVELQHKSAVLSIDFGTANSCAAWLPMSGIQDQEKPRQLGDPDTGSHIFPSVLYISPKGTHRSGVAAVKMEQAYPTRIVRSLKRILDFMAFKTVDGRSYSPRELGSKLIRDICSWACKQANAIPSDVALTVPVEASKTQREIVAKEAKEFFGQEVNIHIFDEATAAACEYMWTHNLRPKEGKDAYHLVIYDFGAGTLDVSVLEVKTLQCKILARRGHPALGGIKFDAILAKIIAIKIGELQSLPEGELKSLPDFYSEVVKLNHDDFTRQFAGNPNRDQFQLMRYCFGRVAEEVKIALSKEEMVKITIDASVPEFKVDRSANQYTLGLLLNKEGIRLTDHDKREVEISRKVYSDAIENEIKSGIKILEAALNSAKRSSGFSLDSVVLTGGMSKTPKLLDEAKKAIFNDEKLKLYENSGLEFDQKTCVSSGAARLVERSRSGVVLEGACRIPGAVGVTEDTNFGKKFKILIHDGVEYGSEGDPNGLPVRVGYSQPVTRNLGYDNTCPDRDEALFINIGTISTVCGAPDKPTMVLRLATDKNGLLTASLDNKIVDVMPYEANNSGLPL
ncbi:MAG: Hsp70 family protein [Deltaproteobacteria bacterium]